MTWPLAGSEYSKYQRASTGWSSTVTLVAAWNALPSVIFSLNVAMIGMPIPTCPPSPMFSETCTGTFFFSTGADEDEEVLDGADDEDGPPGDPVPLLVDVHAVTESAAMAGRANKTRRWRR